MSDYKTRKSLLELQHLVRMEEPRVEEIREKFENKTQKLTMAQRNIVANHGLNKTRMERLAKTVRDAELNYASSLKYDLRKDYYKQKKQIDKLIEAQTKIANRLQRVKDKLSKSENKLFLNDFNIEHTIKPKKNVFRERKSHESKALDGAFHVTYIHGVDEMMTAIGIVNFDYIRNAIEPILTKRFNDERKNTNNNIKYYATFKFVATKQEQYQANVDQDRVINIPLQTLVASNGISDSVRRDMIAFEKALDAITSQGSGFHIKCIKRILIKSNIEKPKTGSSHIELPNWIAKSHSCVNIKNEDQRCFYYALLSWMWYDDIPCRKNEVHSYNKYLNTIKIPEGQSWPVSIIGNDITNFEDINEIAINVFIIGNGNNVVISRHTKNRTISKDKIVNLLLIENETNGHFVWIKSLSALIHDKNCHITKNLCTSCMTSAFKTEELLEAHYLVCNQADCGKIVMPVEGSTLEFNKPQRKFEHFCGVAWDTECLIKNNNGVQEHVMNSWSMQTFFPNEDVRNAYCDGDAKKNDIVIMNNSDPAVLIQALVETFEAKTIELYKLSIKCKDFKDITWESTEQRYTHFQTKHCVECGAKYDGDKIKRVTHHDHVTGKYISSLCNDCNLQFRVQNFVPFYAHNFTGYDGHLIIEGLFKYGQQGIRDCISCVPNTEEKYISVTKKIVVGTYKKMEDGVEVEHPIYFKMKFMDTLSFLPDSLSNLVDSLKSSCSTVEDLRRKFQNMSAKFPEDDKFIMMCQKGVYPYEYINDYERLNEKKLPKINLFYSKLTETKCEKKDYEHAKNVWASFECKSFMDYHNLYLTTDVLLLTDVWQNFRAMALKNYKLDCSYYISAPGYSFDAMLLNTKVKLELLTDETMYTFVQSAIRGGLAQVSKRHAVANNKYMNNYNPDAEQSHIIYMDKNSLYPTCMQLPLPTNNFSWVSVDDLKFWTKEFIMNMDPDGTWGAFLEVTCVVPKNLIHLMNGFVPMPSNIVVNPSDLSPFQQKYCKFNNTPKLCVSFHEKKNYVIHYRHLQTAMSLGIELVTVHKVVTFSQSPFMKSYVDMNNTLRTNATSKFEENFFKFMSNNVFGKTIENVKNRINFRLISSYPEALRVRNLQGWEMFSENLVGVHIKKGNVKLNKPIYLGACILDDSKASMIDFHYNFMIKKFGRDNLDLCFTDTDSLCYHIRHEDPYTIFTNEENKNNFDFSNFPKEHPFYDGSNRKKFGCMKIETAEKQIVELVAVRAKVYAYRTDDGKIKRTCGGVRGNVAKNQIDFNDLLRMVTGNHAITFNQSHIKSKNHTMTTTIDEFTLSGLDTKIEICENGIDTNSIGMRELLSK